jgi:hypothetical protein
MYGSKAERAYINISMLVEPGETFEWSLYVFSRYITDFLCFEYANEPPVAIAIVHQDETVAFYDTGLALDGRCETV